MEIVIIGGIRDMNNIKFFYTLLKIVCIIFTAIAIIMYIIQNQITNDDTISLIMYIFIILTRILICLMGILIITKAYILFKEKKLIDCIGLLSIGLLIIIFLIFVTRFLAYPFYIE